MEKALYKFQLLLLLCLVVYPVKDIHDLPLECFTIVKDPWSDPLGNCVGAGPK